MALPASLGGGLVWPIWKNGGGLLWEIGGNLYAVGYDGTNHHAEIWKSTDGGNTWAEQDAANHKLTRGGSLTAGRSVTACRDGNYIVVLYLSSATATHVIAKFDTSTDTWGTASADGAVGAADVTGNWAFAIACRASNDYVVAYNSATESVMGTAYRRVSVRPFTSGAWGTAAQVEAGVQQHQDLVGLAAGSSSRTHVFYRNSTGNTLRHRSFLSGNTFGTAADVDASIYTTENYVGGVSVPYVDGANTKVVVPYVDSTGDLNVGRFTSADSPSFTTEVVTTTNDPERTNSNPGAVAADGTTVHCFWPNDVDQDLYRDNDAGTGTWGTDTEHRDAITVQGINVATVTNAIGILYDDGGAVKYDAYSLAVTPTFAPPFAPALRRRRHLINR